MLSSLNPGGIGNFVSDLCRIGINSESSELVITYTQAGGELEAKFKSLGLKIVPTLKRTFYINKWPYKVNKIIRNIENKFLFIKVYKLLRKEKPDILHSHEHGSSVIPALLACRLASVKFIIHIHSPSSTYLKNSFNCKIVKLLLRDSDRIIAVSQGAMDQYSELVNLCSSNIRVIPNGIKDIMPKDIKIKNKIENDLGIPQNSFVLGYLGRLIGDKNIETLIKSFFELLNNQYDFYLVIVGGGDYLTVLEDLVFKLGINDRVFFIGKVSNPEYWINIFDINILPSSYEGLPITVIESFCKKIIMVASNVVGVNSIVRNGENGFMFDLNNANELSEIIKVIYASKILKERIEHRARLDFLENYDIEKINLLFIKCYLEMKNSLDS